MIFCSSSLALEQIFYAILFSFVVILSLVLCPVAMRHLVRTDKQLNNH